jgi:transposase-like protein
MSDTPFPPPGWVDRYGAAALLGIGTGTLNLWVRQGRLGYAGALAMGENGVRCRIYALVELERARQEMAAADAARDAAAAKLPEGYVDREGAAAFFGVGTFTLGKWQREGRLGSGTWIDMPVGKRRKVFAVAELERTREQMRAEAARPTAPEGFVELHEAARMLGVHPGTLYQWERQGRVMEGRVVPIPGTCTRTKVYPLEEVRRLREEIATAAENFPPAGWIDLGTASARRGVQQGWPAVSGPRSARDRARAGDELHQDSV